MENPLISEFLQQVKQNKKYKALADEIVLNEIKDYLEKNKITRITKQDVKKIRNSLHLSYASFQTKHKNKINNYLDELKENPDNIELTKKLLSATLSTKERLDNYEEIYRKIFQMIGKPSIIIDLGSGFNPFSYPLMNLHKLTYYAYDINNEDINYLNEYFKIMKEKGLNGKAEVLDVRDKNQINNLPSSDVIFLFKLIDIIDKTSHKPSEELIKDIFNQDEAKYIVASFATKTLTRKQMNHPNRKWFELMLSRNNLKFQTINTDNEIFYVIKN